MATVLVIDPSTSVRETLRIVLGHEHQVSALATVAEVAADAQPDVVVLGLSPLPRDERAIGRALEERLSGVPIVLLHAARDVRLDALVAPDVPVELLPKPFDAYAVRARVRTLVATRRAAARRPSPRAAARRWLEPPLVPAAAAAVVRRVLAAHLPVVHVRGDVGTGVDAVARALHVVGEWRGPFVAFDGARLALGDLARFTGADASAATVYVAHLDRAAPTAQADVLELVERVRDGTTRTRVVVGTEHDLGERAAGGAFVSELAYAVSAVPIVLPALRERIADLPALVETLTREIAARLGLAPPQYPPATLERLGQYLWFGNVAELEAVLTRTLALHRPTVVAPEQVLFLPEDAASAMVSLATPRGAAAASPAASRLSTEGRAQPDLEVVLGELAHELRNPMVTIKTVAQHLDAILADPEARQRFSALMAEAVGRMDGVVETLLDFSRFRAPVPRAVDVGALVDQALHDQREELARRDVRVERNGTGAGTIEVDEAQVAFALRSLCRSLASDVAPHSTLAIRRVGAGAVEMRMRAEPSVAARLSRWIEADGETPPLAWALASMLLERNGGTLSVRKGDDDTTVVRVAWTGTADRARATGVEGTEG